MSSATTDTSNESYSQGCLEGMVSVERATSLQRMSLRRFNRESASDIKLRRFLGHVSVNRRSTEIIQTAMFEEEIIAALETQSVCDEDAATCGVSPIMSSPKILPSTFDKLSEPVTEELVQFPSTASNVLFQRSDFIDLESCRLGTDDTSTADASADLLSTIDEDWMYNVLNLQVAKPGSAQPISRPVAIQLWKIILASLAIFVRKAPQAKVTHSARSHESDGVLESNHLVGLGLGLDCQPRQSGALNHRLQLAT